MKHFARLSLTIILIAVALLPGIQAAYGQTGSEPAAPPEPVVTTPPPVTSLYIPFVNRTTFFSVSGYIKDAYGNPVSGATLVSSNGVQAVSNAQGYYRFASLPVGPNAIAPLAADSIFAPSVTEFNLTAPVENLNFTAANACSELIVNGGFETPGSTWVLSTDSVNTFHAGYNSEYVHSGALAARTGITNQNANQYSYSFVRQQISVPAASTATLRMWLYTKTNDDGVVFAPVIPDAPNAYDAQYVLVLDSADNLLETLLWTRRNDQKWTLFEFNLSKWSGTTIKIEIGSYNDGIEGVTAMWVDDVSLSACSGDVVPPAGCSNALANSGFEGSYGWTIPATQYTAGYSSTRAVAGTRSMRTGIIYTAQDIYSYSDAWQYAEIPTSATSAKLKFYYYPISEEPASLGEPQKPYSINSFGAETLPEDAQYVLVIDEKGVIHYPFWKHKNDQAWIYAEVDLLAYKGQDIRIQFGTYNNGNHQVTAMYMDEMILDICNTIPPTPTPGPTPTPLPTPVPGACTELFTNNGFESTKSWVMPSTAFSAGYSTFLYHKGERSMRTGIYYLSHNRYSYSDAYQQVFIPDGNTDATLGMWVYPRSTSTGPYTSGVAMPETAEGDVQYILILDKHGNWIDTLYWTRSNLQTWTYLEYDLSDYIGDIVRVQFGSYNDGYGAVTSLYVDDASLEACP